MSTTPGNFVWLRCGALALLACVLPASQAAGADQPAVAGPVLAMVFDAPSRSIRPLLGLAGAAHLGAPVWTDVDFGAPAPNRTWALAARGGRLELVRSLDRQPQAGPVEGALSAPERILWSADSSTALAWSSTTSSLEWLRVTADSATVSATTDLGLLPGPVAMLALAPDGAHALAGVEGAGVFVIAPDAAPQWLTSAEEPVAAVFAPGEREVYISDRSARQILDCPDVYGGSGCYAILSEGDGLRDPAGIALTAHGASLLVADRARQSLLIYETGSRALSGALDLEDKPALLEPLATSCFLLTSRTKIEDPLWLLETRPSPAALFVPAAQ